MIINEQIKTIQHSLQRKALTTHHIKQYLMIKELKNFPCVESSIKTNICLKSISLSNSLAAIKTSKKLKYTNPILEKIKRISIAKKKIFKNKEPKNDDNQIAINLIKYINPIKKTLYIAPIISPISPSKNNIDTINTATNLTNGYNKTKTPQLAWQYADIETKKKPLKALSNIENKLPTSLIKTNTSINKVLLTSPKAKPVKTLANIASSKHIPTKLSTPLIKTSTSINKVLLASPKAKPITPIINKKTSSQIKKPQRTIPKITPIAFAAISPIEKKQDISAKSLEGSLAIAKVRTNEWLIDPKTVPMSVLDYENLGHDRLLNRKFSKSAIEKKTEKKSIFKKIEKRAEIKKKPPIKVKAKKITKKKSFYIQIGAFSKYKNALKIKNNNKPYNISLEKGKTLTKAFIGPFENKSEARKAQSKKSFKNSFYKSLITLR